MLDRDPNAKPVNIIHALLLQLDRNQAILRALSERRDLSTLPLVLELITEIERAQQAIWEHDAVAIVRSLQTLTATQLPTATSYVSDST